MDDKETKKYNRKEFFKGFAITLIFIIPIYTAAVLFSSLNTLIFPRKEAKPASEQINTLPIVTAAKSYNLLFAVYDSNMEDKLLTLSLLRFDTQSYRIIICDLPIEMIVLQSKIPQKLSAVFESRGIFGVESAIVETMDISISGFVSVGTNELMGIVDSLGELEYNLTDQISVQNESGIVVYSKNIGNSLFNGNDIAKLLIFGGFSGADKTRMNENLWESALREYTSNTFSEKVLSLYSNSVNTISTNISSASIYKLTKAISAVCNNAGAKTVVYRLEGNFFEDRFELSENSDTSLWVYFPKVI